MGEIEERVPADYPYSVPDLHEWLMSVNDVSRLTLEQVFEAGERYGADLARGSVYMSLPDHEDEAVEYGLPLVDYLRYRILEEMRHDDRRYTSFGGIGRQG